MGDDRSAVPDKPATIHDVAALAGVAPSTVSYVLSGKRSISEETRQRVLAAIERANYTASSLGQRMRRGRAQSIGVASPSLSPDDWSVPEFFGSIAAAAGEQHYTTGFFIDQTPEQLVSLARSRFVDGFLLVETRYEDPRVAELKNANVPIVLVGRTHDLEGLNYVDFCFEEVISIALKHLVALGHEKVAYQMLPSRKPSDINNGFFIEESLKKVRNAYPLELLEVEVPFRDKSAFGATLKLLDEHPDVTAIITHNHIDTLRALHDRHVRVPEECSVVGITTAAAAEACVPSLTSVDVPIVDMTRLAVDMLVAKLNGSEVQKSKVLPAELVRRQSTTTPTAES